MIKKALIWLVSCVCLLSFGAVGVFGEKFDEDIIKDYEEYVYKIV